MSLAARALFVIERSLDDQLTLEEIARRCGVSRFHLAHAFGRATGMSPMAYARARRLSGAALALIAGAPDILGLALDSGYASHEAFSRAFKAQFGKTPEEARQSRRVEALVEPLAPTETTPMRLNTPDFRHAGELKFVGLKSRVPFEKNQTIAEQWRRFMSDAYSAIGRKLDEPPVGVTTAVTDDGFDYICAAGVSSFADIPPGCEKLTLAPADYAIFLHAANVTRIGETYRAIWNEWFPNSDRKPAEAPSLERYPRFDPRTGEGGVEIWAPLRAR